jgi:hypothetical protein
MRIYCLYVLSSQDTLIQQDRMNRGAVGLGFGFITPATCRFRLGTLSRSNMTPILHLSSKAQTHDGLAQPSCNYNLAIILSQRVIDLITSCRCGCRRCPCLKVGWKPAGSFRSAWEAVFLQAWAAAGEQQPPYHHQMAGCETEAQSPIWMAKAVPAGVGATTGSGSEEACTRGSGGERTGPVQSSIEQIMSADTRSAAMSVILQHSLVRQWRRKSGYSVDTLPRHTMPTRSTSRTIIVSEALKARRSA